MAITIPALFQQWRDQAPEKRSLTQYEDGVLLSLDCGEFSSGAWWSIKADESVVPVQLTVAELQAWMIKRAQAQARRNVVDAKAELKQSRRWLRQANKLSLKPRGKS